MGEGCRVVQERRSLLSAGGWARESFLKGGHNGTGGKQEICVQHGHLPKNVTPRKAVASNNCGEKSAWAGSWWPEPHTDTSPGFLASLGGWGLLKSGPYRISPETVD